MLSPIAKKKTQTPAWERAGATLLVRFHFYIWTISATIYISVGYKAMSDKMMRREKFM